jgi:hypothetical protein
MIASKLTLGVVQANLLGIDTMIAQQSFQNLLLARVPQAMSQTAQNVDLLAQRPRMIRFQINNHVGAANVETVLSPHHSSLVKHTNPSLTVLLQSLVIRAQFLRQV